jgi:hypothetical protein
MLTKGCTRLLRVILTSIGILLCIAPTAQAQSNGSLGTTHAAYTPSVNSILNGTVVDEQEAVVADAIVQIKALYGGLATQVRTAQDGRFVVELPAPASYTLLVQHRGFITETRHVTLRGKDSQALRIQLRVGSIGETVNVDSGLRALRHDGARVTDIDGEFVENLPLSGKSLQHLILLSPGTVLTKSTFIEQGQLSVNGQRANANYFMVDGVSANFGVAAGAGLGQSGAGALPSLNVFGGTNALFTLDALHEVKIQTSTYAAEFGRTPGAQVSINTRSGTNQLHGSIFEYFRHDALEANDWFANRDSLRSPSLRHHNFGVVIGGPVNRDRTFFFLTYEGVRVTSPQVATGEVPSLAARQQAPAQMRPFLHAFPVPNGHDDQNGLAKFTASYSEPASTNATAFRIDHKLNGTLRFFARYNYAPSAITQRGVSSSLNTLFQTSFRTATITAGTSLVHSSGISNDFRVNYSRMTAQRNTLLDDLGGAVIPDDLFLFPSQMSRHDSMFGFSLGNGTSFFVGKDIHNLQRQINLVNDLSVLRNTHHFKLGIDYRRLFPIYGRRAYNQNATFNGVAGALAGTASSVSVVTQDEMALVFTNFSAYAQDTWRVKPRLTLTYGLRWEMNPAPTGEGSHDLFTVLGVDDPTMLTLAPRGTPHYKSRFLNFAPRAGLAYQLVQSQGRETVLRAGVGIFYDLGAGTVANSASYFPYLRRKNFANISYPLDPTSAAARTFTLDPPFSSIRVYEPDFKLPLTVQWNGSIEQSLGTRQVLSISYTGAAGRRLIRSEALLNPTPDFQQVFITTNNATSDYHALQLQFQRRLAKRLQASAAYTWSHSIDINSNDSLNNVLAENSNPRLDRASSDFDVRHSFVAAATYDLPSISRRGLGKQLLSNWSLDAIAMVRTATPLDIFIGRDIGFGLSNFRPDRVEGAPLYIQDIAAPGGMIINRAAFAIPDGLRQGSLGRNSLRGFPLSQLNLALRRQFKLSEKFNLQTRTEFINLFNHPNFGDPVGNLNSALFGRSVSMFGRSLGSGGSNGGLSPLYQVGGPRSIQLALKLQF